MPELLIGQRPLLGLSASSPICALALSALRIHTREIALALLMIFALRCLLPYLVVPVDASIAELASTAIPYLVVMAAGQAAAVIAAFMMRRPPLPADATTPRRS